MSNVTNLIFIINSLMYKISIIIINIKTKIKINYDIDVGNI